MLNTTFSTLFIALGIGMLIGLERGWEQREAHEGSRVAGIRTFGLLGLLGGITGLLGQTLGAMVVACGLLAVSALVIAAYVGGSAHHPDRGITSGVAMLLTYGLSVATAVGFRQEAAAMAVLTTVLLGLKPEIHRWLGRLNRQELVAALQLLMLSVVVLPLLPDRSVALLAGANPHRLWWLVVLVASMSFCGHFAIRMLGERRGILLTGLFGGLASSTALTVQFARRSRDFPGTQNLLAAGIALASATVPARMAVEVAVVNRELLPLVISPLLSMSAAGLLAGLCLVFLSSDNPLHPSVASRPFQLVVVMQFAVLLALISVAGELARRYLGDGGVYVLAGVSGLAEADAVTISLASMARGELADAVAARAVVLVAMAAAFSKILLGMVLGTGVLAGRVALASLTMMLPGVPWLFD